ncbi:MAG TPA: hypothetical protein VMU47_02025, partial [Caldimonas sp.]|nr:hypothetical protein [Caldimonas sp.]
SHARHAQARALVRELVAAHDGDASGVRPHARWIEDIGRMLEEPEFADSLARGWSLAWTPDLLRDASPTPITRIALPVPRERRSPVQLEVPAAAAVTPWPEPRLAVEPDARVAPLAARRRRPWALALGGSTLAAALAAPIVYEAWPARWAKAPRPERVAQLPSQASPAGPPLSAVGPRTSASAAPQTPASVASKTEPALASEDDASRRSGTTSVAVAEPVRTEKRPMPRPAIEAAPRAAPLAASQSPQPEASRRVAKHDATTVARSDAAAHAHRNGTHVAAQGAHVRLPPAASRLASTTYGAGALRPTAASIAAVHAPMSTASASGARSALPPRILAMLAATQASSSGVRGDARIAPAGVAASAPANATVAAPAGAAVPTPFPANVPAPPAAAIERASFQPVDYEARAHDVLATHVPRVAQRAERLAARALFLADHAEEGSQLADVLRAADAVRLAPQDPLAALPVWSAEARSFGEASRAAVLRRAAWNEAVEYQTRAFGANPLDAAVAGHLAALQLQRRPIDVLAARSLALHALAVHDAMHPGGRIEDWATLAVANALAGRERDARAAWLVTLALSPGAEHACRAAMDAYATWGERVRESVETLVYRAHQWNRDQGSRDCEWPPRRMAGLTPLN